MKPDLSFMSALPAHPLIPAERRTIRNLAGSLCVAMGILQEERQLVAILGLGAERCNQEAMETLVRCELAGSHFEVGRDSLPLLIRRLQDLEENWEVFDVK